MTAFIRRWLERYLKPEIRRPRFVLFASDFVAVYAIGDVHGSVELLRHAYEKIIEDRSEVTGRKLVVFLGDYVDKGPDSKAVLEFLCEPVREGMHHVCLCGNHDAEFFRFLQDPKSNLGWLDFGGVDTLRSYGVDAKHILKNGGGPDVLHRTVCQAIPDQHIDFLSSLPTMLKVGDMVFVHAGVRPGIPLVEQTDHDLLWIREPFLTEGPKLPLFVFHGHTVTAKPDFGKRRVGIDTGAFATGRLTVLKLSQGTVSMLE
ncbi:serine/threonine protein phosphatase [Rhizobium sp. B21/90]|nr:serine/threonine protein phosphatase [Rhizobium sp. B21/90]